MSKNQLALGEGRITQDDYDRMAVYKFVTYGNSEDLVQEDYSHVGLLSLIPCVEYTPEGELFRDVVNEVYDVFGECEEDVLMEALQDYSPGESVSICNTLRWYWVPEGETYNTYLEGVLAEELDYPGFLDVVDSCDA